jgi:hypothetical protein
MATRRSINWSVAMHDLRAERRPVTNTLRGPDGSWNKQGIMKEAIRLARQLRGGLTWARKLSISLRTAWDKACKEGKPYSPAQADRRFPLSRLVANAGARS